MPTTSAQSKPGGNGSSRHAELLKFGGVYFFLTLINLEGRLTLAPFWFNGRLEYNHAELLAFRYINSEQSRLFQFYIPEAFHRVLGLSIVHAYIVQHFLFIFLAFTCFHFYLKKWFGVQLAFAGVLFLSAVIPLSYFNELQESQPLLLLSFLLALWAIRDHRTVWYVIVLTLGAINNETMLILPAVFFLYNLERFELKHFLRLSAITLAGALPAFLIVGIIHYINWAKPHAVSVVQWRNNLRGIWEQLRTSPLDYWDAKFFFILFLFGAFWVYAFLRYSNKPMFLRRAALIVPIFILVHFLFGIISEARLMLPLSFIIIPMAFFYLFPKQLEPNQSEIENA